MAVVTGIASCVLVAILSRFVFRLPKPSGMEMKLVWIPVVVEIAIFFLLSRFVPMDERTLWIVALAVVGLHFLPMIWSYGPLIAILGVACLGVAAAGWLVPSIPLNWVIAIDGILKLVFGLVMLAGLFRGQGQPAAA